MLTEGDSKASSTKLRLRAGRDRRHERVPGRRRAKFSGALATIVLVAWAGAVGSVTSTVVRRVQTARLAATVPSPNTLDDLLRTFNVGAIPADFVIVVDTSASMEYPPNPPYPGVKAAYAELVNAIGLGDHLSVVTFSDVPHVNFERTIDSTAARESALRALPDVADGQATDIGAALDETLKRLERVDSSEVEIVLFLTDGKHEPPANSAFVTPGNPAWVQLGARGKAVASVHLLQTYGVGLGSSTSTDVGLLRTVLPSPTIVALPPDQIAPFFREAVRQSQVLRLRKPLKSELDSGGVTAAVPSAPPLASTADLNISLTSTYKHLASDTRIQSATVTDDAGRQVKAELVGGPTTVHIDPGQRSVVHVRVTVEAPRVRFRVPRKVETRTLTVRLTGSVAVQPSDVITRTVQLPATKPLASPPPVTLSRTVGYAWSFVLAVLALAIIALTMAYLFVRWLVVPPPLVGYIEPAGAGERRTVRLTGKRMVLDHKKLPEFGGAAVEVFTHVRRRKRVYAQPKRGDFEVQDGRRFKAIVGETELSSGEKYRVGGALVRWWLAPKKK